MCLSYNKRSIRLGCNLKLVVSVNCYLCFNNPLVCKFALVYCLSCRWLFLLSSQVIETNTYSSRLHNLNAFSLIWCKLCSPLKLFPMKHSIRLYKSSMLSFKGSQRRHIIEFARNLTLNSISLSMHVLWTIVQKGGDCKSKSFAPWVLDIVGQITRGTNMFASMKQMVRFLKP